MNRPSDGAQIEAIAASLGKTLTPMQRYVADVGTERRPDGSYEYQVVVWTVPRQTGKTTGQHAIATHRAAVLGRDVWHTAQTGQDARARWMDLVKVVTDEDSVWRDEVALSLRGGSEELKFNAGAGIHPFPPLPKKLHGYTPPCVMIDEAFSLEPGDGELLIGAISPAQLTLLDKQLWIVSTMGTAQSTFFHDWVDKARAFTPRVAIFDWGARDDQDPFNLDDIAAFHPGVGFEFNGKKLTAHDVLAEAENNSKAEFERAFGNRSTVTASHLIPLEDWRKLADKHAAPAGAVLTYDVAADRQAGTIVLSWLDVETGVVRVSVSAAAAGVSWLVDAVEATSRIMRPVVVAAADHGPVLEVTAALRSRGVEVRSITEREFATASGALLTHITEGTIRHDGSDDGTDVLSRSVTGLVTRAGAVDGVAFSRRHSVGDSSAGVAAALGAWLAGQESTSKPIIFFAS